VSVSVDTQGKAMLNAAGTAKNFNTLANASSDFSNDARLKNAIFSNIAIGSKGTVSFGLTATIDPKLIAYTASNSGAASAAAAAMSDTTAAAVIPVGAATSSTTQATTSPTTP
jgi:hypothetical protein